MWSMWTWNLECDVGCWVAMLGCGYVDSRGRGAVAAVAWNLEIGWLECATGPSAQRAVRKRAEKLKATM